jgi:hypothetical protein
LPSAILSHALTDPAVVRDAPTVGAGPCPTQGKAKREAAKLNARYGGPGFFVEDRTGDLIQRPHAYFAERSGSGEWYAVLKEMPAGPVASL